ncbi:unnamed protein product [Adineta ricciae]|uniref:Uncharacterized protein n=1 Tax=Adineta ricciae TaxID=249248 RepID=A0A815S959_ADIRI|nr:unnamed protein product [Adineta ricciae]
MSTFIGAILPFACLKNQVHRFDISYLDIKTSQLLVQNRRRNKERVKTINDAFLCQCFPSLFETTSTIVR